ncbi:NAD-dependent protein deacylase [Cutibacterium sp. WCA-380-WT-3A]|uniref:NAD-dependent protein deacetylase n=1 Tax=Cutibacterium porci TaxID=2605781 RepID=A0A7K0J3H7_9ACTN|nr:NAD-dependent protein deacylase [Cutibacterium porci]MSS44480.1 NAD-dependent protein deacylase [Cutibacterium porci]
MTGEQLAGWIDESTSTVFFGGAGMSTESGIPDFRSAGGLYTIRHDVPYPAEYMLSHGCLVEHPGEFFDFYRTYLVHPEAKPNIGHRALAALERAGKISAIITQNIDGLHQEAGSRHVIELHGSIHRNRCVNCGSAHSLSVIMDTPGIPRCSCGGMVRPEVVLYEESLRSQDLDDAMTAISTADLLIVGGTSLNVYPAAALLRFFRGRHLVLINREDTGYDRAADLVIRGGLGETLSAVQHAIMVRGEKSAPTGGAYDETG